MIDQLLDFVIRQGTVLKDNNLTLKLSIIFLIILFHRIYFTIV